MLLIFSPPLLTSDDAKGPTCLGQRLDLGMKQSSSVKEVVRFGDPSVMNLFWGLAMLRHESTIQAGHLDSGQSFGATNVIRILFQPACQIESAIESKDY